MPDVGLLWCFFNTSVMRGLALFVAGGGLAAAFRMLSSMPHKRKGSSKLRHGPIAQFNRTRRRVVGVAVALMVGAVGGVGVYFYVYAALDGVTSCPLPDGAVPDRRCVYGLYVLGVVMLVAVGVGELLQRELKKA